MSEFFGKLWYLFRHLNENNAWTGMLDLIGTPAVYATLFAIIFCETGLVILPFLPGDSLLFALGAISARDFAPEYGLGFWPLFFLLTIAAIIGDAVNYWIGKRLGPAVFNRVDTNSDGTQRQKRLSDRLLNRDHLLKAQAFYEKHGGKTIILARFVPIIRTFAPFVAGVGKMSYPRFATYNIVGGIIWVLTCMTAGRLFGGISWVNKNFELVIIAIIVISVLPVVVEFIKARRADKKGGDAILEATTIGEKVD